MQPSIPHVMIALKRKNNVLDNLSTVLSLGTAAYRSVVYRYRYKITESYTVKVPPIQILTLLLFTVLRYVTGVW